MKLLIIVLLFSFSPGYTFSQNSPGETIYIPANESTREFAQGVFGYNPNISLEENKKRYSDYGYNISYKIKDTTIFMLFGLVILIIIIIGFLMNKKKSYEEKFQTQ